MGSNFNRVVRVGCPEKGTLNNGFEEVKGGAGAKA